jgi:hypothetical protein
MKKRMIGIIIAITLVVSSFGAYTLFNRGSGKVFAAEFREGYTVRPLSSDQAGVKANSSFRFEWDEEAQPVSLEEIQTELTISPEVELVMSEDEGGFLITPTVALQANTIYVFDFKGITWAYKTEAEFSLIGNVSSQYDNQCTD